jgi:putative two-component system response regulator
MKEDIVLIVEDNDVLREGLKEMLAGEGFNSLTASDGREALEIMETTRPALILSDINMPEMDGFEFFNAVRARQEWLTIPFIYLTARSELADVLTGKNLGAEDYLTKPISKEELITTVRSRLGRFRQVQLGQLQQAYVASLTALANAIEERIRDTRGHIERVTDYSLMMAGYLGWSQRGIRQLRFGAILHDIGKIHLPEEILFKAPPLSDADWALIRQHPINGERMIKDVEDLVECAPIVRHHHERWDGKGYPDGLKGGEIPQGASIVAVADAFDVMTTSRPYRPKRSPIEAYQEILQLAGENYDPAVVKAFQQAWKENKIHLILSLG